ncbi:MAG: hypothetical protein GQ527_01945 [Bacteroidales bacterium]|nr:hypothetical protein [Bacteroidales bacterium]
MKKSIFLSLVFIFILLSSCQRYTLKTVYPTLSDGKYDTEFPYKTCSKQIAQVVKSIKKLHCIAEYKTYIIPLDAEVTVDMIDKKLLRQKNIIKKFDSESVIGTATIIYYDQQKIAVLSSAHVVSYPDTIIGYYEGTNKNGKELVQTFSLKSRQLNYVRDLPIKKNLEILAIDKKQDIVILGQEVDLERKREVSVFDYPIGNSDELEWGSFVYIIGYPSGYQMITRGIVSTPGGKHKKSFLIDALFNKGISGGVVLAIKDGVPNFEFVGMAKSVSASYENILVPMEENHIRKYNPNIPYEENVYVRVKKEINYGITYSVASNTIKDFIKDHEMDLAAKGYLLTQFLRKPEEILKP